MNVGFFTSLSDRKDTGPGLYRRHLAQSYCNLENPNFTFIHHKHSKQNFYNEKEEILVPSPPFTDRILDFLGKERETLPHSRNILTEPFLKYRYDNEFDILHYQILPYKRLFWIWNMDAKVITTFHAADWTEDWHHQNHPFKKKLYSWLLNNFDAVITVSNHAKKILQENLGVTETDIFVIHNAPPPSFTPTVNESVLSKYNLPDNYIFHLSNKSKRKNPKGIIGGFQRAVQNYNMDLDLVFAGGRWDERIYDYCSEEIREKIHFLGFVPREDLPTIYTNSGLFIMPSYSESCSIAQLEAMACGTPVLTTNNAGMPEVGRGSGIYVNDPDDIDEIGNKIVKTYDQRDELGKHALQLAQSRTWDDVVKETIQAYQQILGK